MEQIRHHLTSLEDSAIWAKTTIFRKKVLSSTKTMSPITIETRPTSSKLICYSVVEERKPALSTRRFSQSTTRTCRVQARCTGSSTQMLRLARAHTELWLTTRSHPAWVLRPSRATISSTMDLAMVWTSRPSSRASPSLVWLRKTSNRCKVHQAWCKMCTSDFASTKAPRAKTACQKLCSKRKHRVQTSTSPRQPQLLAKTSDSEEEFDRWNFIRNLKYKVKRHFYTHTNWRSK